MQYIIKYFDGREVKVDKVYAYSEQHAISQVCAVEVYTINQINKTI